MKTFHIAILLSFLSINFVFTKAQTSETNSSEMDVFIDELMAKMTLLEKLGQLNLSGGVGGLDINAEGDKRLDYIRQGLIGISQGKKEQEIAVNESRLGIPLLAGRDVIHGYTTIFPIPLAMSCMWDTDLIEKHARIAAEEASVSGINWTWSPMVDISRDPRWGRVAEGAGEDPLLGSLIAQAYVRGYQGSDLSASNTIMACVKHFALYGASEAGRDYNDVDMSRLSMFQYYFPPYKAAFDAGAASAMTSFNVIDGVPATGNKWLMDDLLRKSWGFDGVIVTDYTAINEMIHHGLGNLQEVSALALKATVDIDMMGQGYIGTLGKSLKEGKVSQADIDNACRRVLEAKYKLGLFSDPFKYFNEKKAEKIILSEEHLRVAREISARSIVLLKNKNQLLPLSKKSKIAVIGPLADSKLDMLGTWAITDDTSKVVTILEGIQQAVESKGQVYYAKGSYATMDTFLLNRNIGNRPRITRSEKKRQEMLREAKEVAENAEIIVAVLGEPRAWSGEASSMANISLAECQKELLKEMLATGKPVVLVLANGRPMTIAWENENVPAIIEAWHGGTMAGAGLADVLFGDFNPSGKLTTTFPVSVGQIPVYYNHRNTGRPYIDGYKFTTKYLDIPNEPLYPFGYGLSYTQFEYGNIYLSDTLLSSEQQLKAEITIKNIGEVDGEEVVQLYIRDIAASVSRPVKELKGFQKIEIAKGEAKTATFTITSEELKFYNYDLKYDWEPGEFEIMIGGNSRDVKSATVKWNK
jgi:beta-glucosidase